MRAELLELHELIERLKAKLNVASALCSCLMEEEERRLAMKESKTTEDKTE